MNATAVTPFDALAAEYDDTFTNTVVGGVMREAVWRRLSALFPSGSSVLELNCGTGVDAAWLMDHGVTVYATDSSLAMVSQARARGVDASQMSAEEVGALAARRDLPLFDGALSNFGGLNCVQDLGAVAEGLARCVRPGGRALLCVMGRAVPWEWLWYLRQGNPRVAFRRFRENLQWRGLTIRYPSVGSLRRAFAPTWIVRRTWGLGALVPPSYAEQWAARHPRAVTLFNGVERRIEAWPLVARVSDHFVMELVRR